MNTYDTAALVASFLAECGWSRPASFHHGLNLLPYSMAVSKYNLEPLDIDECSDADSSSSSVTSSEESDDSSDEEYERQMSAEELKELEAKVPRTELGEYTSLGSRAHPHCNPCVFHAHSKMTCSQGLKCGYCHFPHQDFIKSLTKRLTSKGRLGKAVSLK
eukprot:gb/GFBE01015273.1/.p1 GENE.gb/GFBE01015273.1/~~gb/GFBE01015273.1/.p1  ORF type:complete len:161 (+),score=29.44 gb/GFBE01015273.1/:1-483(+)